jgi:hypothetical protein
MKPFPYFPFERIFGRFGRTELAKKILAKFIGIRRRLELFQPGRQTLLDGVAFAAAELATGFGQSPFGGFIQAHGQHDGKTSNIMYDSITTAPSDPWQDYSGIRPNGPGAAHRLASTKEETTERRRDGKRKSGRPTAYSIASIRYRFDTYPGQPIIPAGENGDARSPSAAGTPFSRNRLGQDSIQFHRVDI